MAPASSWLLRPSRSWLGSGRRLAARCEPSRSRASLAMNGTRSFSPDGGQIAFAWDGEKRDNEDIYVKVIGTEVPLRLTTNPAADRHPAWSLDGRYIAFLRCSVDGGGLFVVPALGGPERQIHWRSTSLGICASGASWSPDGQFLAIADTDESEITWSIFILSLETLKKRKLTSPPPGAHGDFAPAFSPDGRTIAFNRMSPAGGIYVVPTAGGDPRRVTVEQYYWFGASRLDPHRTRADFLVQRRRPWKQ